MPLVKSWTNGKVKVVRQEGPELSTFWFVREQGQNLNALFGVACEATRDTLIRVMIPKGWALATAGRGPVFEVRPRGH
jgi:hypothetical protein